MPEVVEVCMTALWLNSIFSGTQMTGLTVQSGRYQKRPISGISYFEIGKPYTIKKIDSKGKFMWFELIGATQNCYIMCKFGLEGEWSLSSGKYSRVKFETNSEQYKEIFFNDMISYGTIEIGNDAKLTSELNKLAPDFLKVPFNGADLYARIGKLICDKNGNIVKSKGDKKCIKVLMEQKMSSGIGSGLGNYLSVEILYDCKISPHKTMKSLYENKKLCYELAHSIKYVTKLSFFDSNTGYLEKLDPSMSKFIIDLRHSVEQDIKNNVSNIYNFHPEIILKEGDHFQFKVYRQKKDPFDNPVLADKIIKGRTTYWVPTVQTL